MCVCVCAPDSIPLYPSPWTGSSPQWLYCSHTPFSLTFHLQTRCCWLSLAFIFPVFFLIFNSLRLPEHHMNYPYKCITIDCVFIQLFMNKHSAAGSFYKDRNTACAHQHWLCFSPRLPPYYFLDAVIITWVYVPSHLKTISLYLGRQAEIPYLILKNSMWSQLKYSVVEGNYVHIHIYTVLLLHAPTSLH